MQMFLYCVSLWPPWLAPINNHLIPVETTFDSDGVWYEDGALDTVDPREDDDHVTLVARFHGWHRLSVELKHTVYRLM